MNKQSKILIKKKQRYNFLFFHLKSKRKEKI